MLPLFQSPDADPRGPWEAWAAMAGLAAALPGAPLGTMVACTSFHNPGSIAKMAEAIDSITQGNFLLGLGCGWQSRNTMCSASPLTVGMRQHLVSIDPRTSDNSERFAKVIEVFDRG